MSDLQVTFAGLSRCANVFRLMKLSARLITRCWNRLPYTWQSTLNRVYSNSHYIIISIPDRPDALKDLNCASQTLMATLSEYGVRAMFESEDSLPKDSPFHVFSRICSPVSKPDPKRVRSAEAPR